MFPIGGRLLIGDSLFAGCSEAEDSAAKWIKQLDEPNWFERGNDNCRHIFTRSAQKGVVLPAGVNLYEEHALKLDGTPNQPTVLAHALMLDHGGHRGG